MSKLARKRCIASGAAGLLTSWTGFDFRGCRLKEVERDVLCELEGAGVDLADVGTGVDFCSLIDDKEGFFAVCDVCVVRDFTRLSFLRATTLSFATQISIEEQTVARDMCWSKIVFT
jgi:hypothetical protein